MSSFLTDAELTQLRADMADLLLDACRIERSIITNVDGIPEESWGTAVVSTACRLDPDQRRGQADEIGDREAGVARYILTVGWNTDVRDGDRAVLLDSNGSAVSGGTYQLDEIWDNHSKRAVRRVRVTTIREV